MKKHQESAKCSSVSEKKSKTMNAKAAWGKWFAPRPTNTESYSTSSEGTHPVIERLGRASVANINLAKDLPNNLALFSRAQKLVLQLPESVQIGGPQDQYYTNFREYPKDLPKEDVWETLDPLLNGVLGAGVDIAKVASSIRRGEYGVECLLRYMISAVRIHHIAPTLLEGKVKRLEDALEKL